MGWGKSCTLNFSREKRSLQYGKKEKEGGGGRALVAV